MEFMEKKNQDEISSLREQLASVEQKNKVLGVLADELKGVVENRELVLKYRSMAFDQLADLIVETENIALINSAREKLNEVNELLSQHLKETEKTTMELRNAQYLN